jgi:ribonucleoside-diphosphate reductase alpha chain
LATTEATAATTTEEAQVPLDTTRSIGITRRNTRPGIDPYDEVEWEVRDAVIPGKDGPAFEQREVEFPVFWSATATNIVAQKYFRGPLGSPQRERSVRQMISRVVDTITAWGRKDGYFADAEEADAFHAELKHLLVNQYAAFNSPVWFNVGFEERPQCSACFILSIDDSMDSILNWIVEEGRIFRGGSGSGINLSRVRSSKEQLSKGGFASGPVSFMRGADASAGTIKSGGKTRRAAKMVVLDVDHPDIEEFIWCKSREEEKARSLQEAGYDMSLDSPDWASIQYQNANNSVRLTDEFMRAVEADRDWNLTARTSGDVVKTVRARDLMRQIADAAWRCADPGIQFDTIINDWHTCPNTGRINASNPCSEYMHVDNSACNLASLNLMRFRQADGEFDVESFKHAVDVVFTAQEILVSNSSYPTEQIAENAHKMRQLGLGYANLGALLMARGLPYDSDEGRAYAAAITALMTGRAYRKSAEIAARMGAFSEYERNRQPMVRVIEKHRAAVGNIEDRETIADDLVDAARGAWDDALELGRTYGYRNAQATVLAPTGTISFLMDCDTTGVEPDFSLVKTKRLVGGGELTMVNGTVPLALQVLGYTQTEGEAIVAHIADRNTVVGAPAIKPEHLAVFDCAMGDRAIDYNGHVSMMGAVQPFISGAISKTANMPESATVEDVAKLYLDSWKMGVKALAIYRDNCKVAQPMGAKQSELVHKPVRKTMPIERMEIGRKFQVGEYEGYIHVGLFPDGTPGDVFVDIAKEGTTLAGLMNALMISVSLGLQYGVPLDVYVSKFSHMRFEPSGLTNDPDIRVAKSLVDYIFRWLGKKFLDADTQAELGIMSAEVRARLQGMPAEAEPLADGTMFGDLVASPEATGAAAVLPAQTPGQRALFNAWEDAQECAKCGGRKIRTGSCYTCRDCGDNSGCG